MLFFLEAIDKSAVGGGRSIVSYAVSLALYMLLEKLDSGGKTTDQSSMTL